MSVRTRKTQRVAQWMVMLCTIGAMFVSDGAHGDEAGVVIGSRADAEASDVTSDPRVVTPVPVDVRDVPTGVRDNPLLNKIPYVTRLFQNSPKYSVAPAPVFAVKPQPRLQAYLIHAVISEERDGKQKKLAEPSLITLSGRDASVMTGARHAFAVTSHQDAKPARNVIELDTGIQVGVLVTHSVNDIVNFDVSITTTAINSVEVNKTQPDAPTQSVTSQSVTSRHIGRTTLGKSLTLTHKSGENTQTVTLTIEQAELAAPTPNAEP